MWVPAAVANSCTPFTLLYFTYYNYKRWPGGRCQRGEICPITVAPRSSWYSAIHGFPGLPTALRQAPFRCLRSRSLADLSPISNDDQDKADSRVIDRIHISRCDPNCSSLKNAVITKFKVHARHQEVIDIAGVILISWREIHDVVRKFGFCIRSVPEKIPRFITTQETGLF